MRTKIIHSFICLTLFLIMDACSTFQFTEINTIISAKWRLVAVRANANESFTRSFPDNIPNLEVNRDGHYSGYSGCNHFFGDLAMNGRSIKFEGITASSKLCPENQNLGEILLMALGNVDNYSIESSTLSLKQGNSVLIMYRAY